MTLDKRTTLKPWGNFEQFTNNENSTVKILNISDNASISLQYHNKRNEFWKIISGRCIVIIGEEEYNAIKGDEFFIEKKIKHRIITEKECCSILEISFGEFDEEDIVRIEDKYKRILK